MKSKRFAYLLSTALSLSLTLAYSPALQASFSKEELQALTEVNHTNIKKIVERQFQENRELLNSSKDKDIVVFLGKTGAGKSTLINYLSGKELKVDDNGIDIVLNNAADTQAMRIGDAGLTSETFLPKFINANNLLLYDLPGFGDTRGTAISLINAYFIKTLIQNAKTVRLVFVTSHEELKAEKAKVFKELIEITKKLVPNQTIEDCSALIITKTNAGQNKQQVVTYFQKHTQTDITNPATSLLAPWINKQTLTKMSAPFQNAINQNDKLDITNVILQTVPKKLDDVNIAVIYNGDEQNKLKDIYQAEINEVSNKLYNDNFNAATITTLDRMNLDNKRIYFQNSFINNITTILDQAPLILLLKPLSLNIYVTAWNERKETLQLRVNETVRAIEVQIKEQERRKAEDEKKIAQQQRADEERRRIQADNDRRSADQRFAIEEQKRKEAENAKKLADDNTKQQEQRRIQAEQELQQIKYQQDIDWSNSKKLDWSSEEGGISMTTFNNKLFMAYQDQSNTISVKCSDDGQTWTGFEPSQMKSDFGGISMTSFKGKLSLIYQRQNEGSKEIHRPTRLAFSNGNEGWTLPKENNDSYGAEGGISLEVFDNKLYGAVVASNGKDWTETHGWVGYHHDEDPKSSIPMFYHTVKFSIKGIALKAFQNKLFMAVQTDKIDNNFCMFSSTDGSNWLGPELIQHIQCTDGGISMACYNEKLYVAYQGKDGYVNVTSSKDGLKDWSHAKKIGPVSDGGITMSILNNKLFLAYQSTDNKSLYITSSK